MSEHINMNEFVIGFLVVFLTPIWIPFLLFIWLEERLGILERHISCNINWVDEPLANPCNIYHNYRIHQDTIWQYITQREMENEYGCK